MIVIDPGHIYYLWLDENGDPVFLKFVKRSGGAVQYSQEWPGIQTQAVMRALIDYLEWLVANPDTQKTYELWQLGTDASFPLTLRTRDDVFEVLDVLIDRSDYLNRILNCVETMDAVCWLSTTRTVLCNPTGDVEANHDEAMYSVRMALWCYEARAYRRKQEHVNREQPAHDDSVTPKAWRYRICDDVPFNEEAIELIPIGSDGHIVL